MNEQLSIDVAATLRDVGIARAAQHAEADSPGWTSLALAYVARYCREASADALFTTEDIVDAFNAAGLEKPATEKAWGAVIKRAVRAKYLECEDFAGRRRKGHCSPCPRWRSLVSGKRWTELR